jgi:hypothetical protein
MTAPSATGEFPLTEQNAAAPAETHRYFRETPQRAEKGSAMIMIAAEADLTRMKNERLKAARMARDEAARLELAKTVAVPKPKRRSRATAAA